MRMRCILVGIACILVLSQSAFAWERRACEDPELMVRSELIVIGAIKPGSIQYVPHIEPDGVHWWEHNATLEIHEILKGKCDQKEIPIVIHYGLEPMINDRPIHDGFAAALPTTGPVPAVEIDDEADEPIRIVDDACQDNVWCLRHTDGLFGRLPPDKNLGIDEPEDLQPLVFKNYLCCYLSSDPETNVRRELQKEPKVTKTSG
jgi:hypothetical protein